MTLLLRSPLIASLLLLGCSPLPESVGEGLETGDGGDPSGEGLTADTNGSEDTAAGDDTVEDDPEPKWELLFESDTRCTDLAVMPDGGVIMLLRNTTAEGPGAERRLRRYTPDGTLAWQRPDGTEMLDMTTLPDGRILVGGAVSEAPRQAALWLLSPEGEVEATYVQPLDGTGDDALVTSVAAAPSGVAFIVVHLDDESPSDYIPLRYEAASAGLDLVPLWWIPEVDALAANLHSVQIAASGSIRTLQLEFTPESGRMRTFSAAGVLEDDEVVPSWATFAVGEPGVVLGYDAAGLHVQGLTEAPELGDHLFEVELSNWPSAYHQDGLFIGSAVPGSTAAWVRRLDVDGTQVYERTFAPSEGPQVLLNLVVPGPDESVYLCGAEIDEGGHDPRGFLSRRYPLW